MLPPILSRIDDMGSAAPSWPFFVVWVAIFVGPFVLNYFSKRKA